MWNIDELIRKSANVELKFTKEDYLRSIPVLNDAQILLACITYDYKHGETYPRKDELRTNIKKQFDSIFSGYEPTFENGHIWAYSLLCQAISLIKKKNSLWILFSAEEQRKLTLIMKMFAYMWNFGCNVHNGFYTGITLKGNYSKFWKSPNYWLCNQVLLLFLVPFFGSIKALNKMFTTTSYDELMSELLYCNFYNAHTAWSTPGFTRINGSVSNGAKELFGVIDQKYGDGSFEDPNRREAYVKTREYGYENEYYAGAGVGVTIPVFYKRDQFEKKDFDTFPIWLFKEGMGITFGKELPCVSVINIDSEEDFSTHIKDGTLSPYEGEMGMMTEFNKKDGFGQRSSLFHCEIDFILVSTMLSTLKYLIGFDYNSYERKRFVDVGINDFIYKKEHGYIGYSMGHIETDNYTNKIDSLLWREWWKNKEA